MITKAKFTVRALGTVAEKQSEGYLKSIARAKIMTIMDEIGLDIYDIDSIVKVESVIVHDVKIEKFMDNEKIGIVSGKAVVTLVWKA